MKKLLSILAAVGLTATASTAVVACGSSKSNKEVNVEVKKAGDSFTISSKDPVKMDLATAPTAEIKKDGVFPTTALGSLVFADKDGKKFKIKDGKATVKVIAAEDIAKDAKTANVKFEITIDKAAATTLGLIDKDGKAGKDVLIKLGTKDKDGNLAKELFEFNLKATDFAAAK